MNERQKYGESPLVSVIMAVYNGEKYVAEAIKSVLSQTYDNIQLLVTDDGSTDGTPEILSRLSASDDRIIVTRIDNRGLSGARNASLEKVVGEIITFIDSDDIYHPEAIENLVRLMKSGDADVVAGGLIMTEKEPAGWREKPLKVDSVKHLSGEEALVCSLYQRPAINSVCQLTVRGSLFRGDNGLRFIEGLYYEDLELTSRLYLRCNKIVVTDMHHYFYRQDGGSFIHRFSEKRLDALKVTEKIEALVKNRGEDLKKAAYDRRFSACYNIYLLLADTVEENRYDEVSSMCWREIRERRWKTLTNPRVRLKNKLGALISYLGGSVVKRLKG